MRTDATVEQLVQRARAYDKAAWDEIVERFAPLVWAICARRGLSPADREDVGQGVWMRLVEHLDRLREPAALPGWLVATTRHECDRVLRLTVQRQTVERRAAREVQTGVGQPDADDHLLRAERYAALREAFADLPAQCRELVGLLLREPPLSYTEIAARMGRPVGSVGPSRARCLDRLRRHPALRDVMPSSGRQADQGNGHV